VRCEKSIWGGMVAFHRSQRPRVQCAMT